MYSIHIEREVFHLFKTKKEAKDYIRKYKNVLTDNLPIMLNLQMQLEMLRNQHYQFMNTRLQRELYQNLVDFEKEFALIFWNNGGDNFTYVQFNKIRVAMNIIDNAIAIIKRYGQVNKHKVLLNQLYAIEKIFILMQKNYNQEVRGLYVAHGYREGLRTLKPSINEKHTPYKAS
ncbi:hypothetical protein [Flagellimonas sp. CMM7]|uniref:hypothetical protein n=1 Tax=Flagellimonas sp. CMM7 TaxID=2654676 RepID=UPI0013D4905F|nr:hypothetical protein [Flagellimonas sp. CMM7]UII79559.1 hypothetical protein LV704_18100 [Flagellimonas sp. CMM7]